MEKKNNKPKYTSKALISKMKDEKGIKFTITTEKDAELYLLNTNNYLRTASYRKNYQKYENGKENLGKYIDLEFAYLQELSTIDMHLRNIVSEMTRDIEHSIKVMILRQIESDCNEDGYSIVKDFLDFNTHIVHSLGAMSCSPFTGDLIFSYFTIEHEEDPKTGKTKNYITDYTKCPIWVFFELITFGELISFYDFYYKRIKNPNFVHKNILHLTKSLRNAASHNNCIIANLSHHTSRPPEEITQRISKITEINKSQRKKKLTTRPTLEFISLLYCYDIFVSEKVKVNRINKLKDLFFERMCRHKDYFVNNELISSTYNFCCKAINGIFDF